MRWNVVQCLSLGCLFEQALKFRSKTKDALNRITNLHITQVNAAFLEAVRLTGHGITAFCRHAVAAILGIAILYLSMVASSAPLSAEHWQTVERAIALLESKGFDTDATLLRTAATFRGSDNWLNANLVPKENAYAAANFPVGIITIYQDFYSKAVDDTERAAVLLHEAQHLKGGDEHAAYDYVWQHRGQLGWTIQTHGTTESYITIEEQTREEAPELFTCSDRLFNDCTEQFNTGKRRTLIAGRK